MTNERLLQGTERSWLLRPLQRIGLVRGWLHEQSFSEYLYDDEDVEYIFDITTPITVKDADRTSEMAPENRYRTIISFSDVRVLFAVGRQPENQTGFIQWSDVNSISLSPTQLSTEFDPSYEPEEPQSTIDFSFKTKHRLLEFSSNKEYSPSEAIGEFASFLTERTNIDNMEGMSDWEAAQDQYAKAQSEYERRLKRRKRVAQQAEGNSITPRIVKKTASELRTDEQPQFYISGENHIHQITHSSTRNPTNEYNFQWGVFTDQRLILSSGSERWSIEYFDITTATANEREYIKEETKRKDGETKTVEKPVTKTQLDIHDRIGVHIIDVNNLSQRELSKLLNYLQARITGKSR